MPYKTRVSWGFLWCVVLGWCIANAQETNTDEEVIELHMPPVHPKKVIERVYL